MPTFKIKSSVYSGFCVVYILLLTLAITDNSNNKSLFPNEVYNTIKKQVRQSHEGLMTGLCRTETKLDMGVQNVKSLFK